MQPNGKLTPDMDRQQKSQTARSALEELLRRTIQTTFTGTAAVEVDVHRGMINQVRLNVKEVKY
jgi:hypothetical protein